MKRLTGFLLTALLLLTACQSRTADPRPEVKPPVVASPAVSSEPAPPPAPTVPPVAPATPDKPRTTGPLAAICQPQDRSGRMQTLRQYIETALQGVDPATVTDRIEHEPGTCLSAKKGERTDMFLITGDHTAGWIAAVAWREMGRWRAAPVVHEGDVILPGKDALVDGRPDLLLLSASSGSGGAKHLLHFHVDAAGQPVTKEVTGWYGRSWFEFLTDDLVLVTHRDQLSDEFDDCNGCVPSLEQVLFRWDGQQMTQIGARMQADPELTLNRLRDALRANRPGEAAALVSDPALLPLATQALSKSVRGYEDYGPGTREIAHVEAHNWDLLPPVVRTPLPPRLQTFFAAVQLDAGTALIRMEARTAGWLVTGISLPTDAKPPGLAQAAAALGQFDQATAETAPQVLREAVPAVLGYLRTLGADGPLPHITLVQAGPSIRLIHLGGKATELLKGGWTWVAWSDGKERIQTLNQADGWKPVQAARLPGPETFMVVVVRQEVQPPFRMAVAVYNGQASAWDGADAFPGAWEMAKASPVPFSSDYPGLITKDGTTISLRERGEVLALCAQSGSPCMTFRWNRKQYVKQP